MIYPRQAVAAQQLTIVAVTYYTAPAGVTPLSGVNFIPTAWTFHNADAGPAAVTVSVYVVPDGGAAATSNLLVKRALGPGQTWTPWELLRHVLKPGDMIQMLADKAASVTVLISGYEQVQN